MLLNLEKENSEFGTNDFAIEAKTIIRYNCSGVNNSNITICFCLSFIVEILYNVTFLLIIFFISIKVKENTGRSNELFLALILQYN